MRHSKLTPEVNAGSMADIAFLLLMFFLVSSAIPNDTGFNRKLPKECPPNTDCSKEISKRNTLNIIINNQDEIMVNDRPTPLSELKNITKDFVDNNGNGTCGYCKGKRLSIASEHPKEAILSLTTGKQTSYTTFIAVQDELTKAFYELRNTYAQEILKKDAENLSSMDMQELKDVYPFVLSETSLK